LSSRKASSCSDSFPFKSIHTTSIPLLNILERAVPGAEFILWGAQDVEHARIHGTDESVDLAELERCILAQVRFFDLLGARTAT
jgi:hypothetical protein